MASMDAVFNRTVSDAGDVSGVISDTFDADRQCWCGTDVRPACSQGCPALPPAFVPSPGQLRFLRLHALHLVERWQWHWLDTMLRAYTDRGDTATIWRDDVEQLLQQGLMEAGMGFTMSVTIKGRAAC